MMPLLKIHQNHPLKSYTTLKVGGRARYFVEVESVEALREAFLWAKQKEVPTYVLGKGSNTFFIDELFEALVILNKIHYIRWELPFVTCSSSYSLSLLSSQSARKGYSGLEGGTGIPASIGGALFMNAGAGTWDIQGALKKVLYLTLQGDLIEYDKDELVFGYRHSIFQSWLGAIVEATFELQPNPEASKIQQSIIQKRLLTQPYKSHSAGCFFKNPIGTSAGALIDKAGLKGSCEGDAAVSEIHANFLINQNEATSRDILQLESRVKKGVFETFGVQLEREVRTIGNIS